MNWNHLSSTSSHHQFPTFSFQVLFLGIYTLFFSFILSLCSPSFHVGIKTPVMRFRFTQSSEELQKNSSNHPRWPREPSLSSGRKAREDEEAQGHVPRLDPPFITSVRIGRRGLRELPINLEREHLKRQISISFHALRWGTEPERARERETSPKNWLRLSSGDAATDTDEMRSIRPFKERVSVSLNEDDAYNTDE